MKRTGVALVLLAGLAGCVSPDGSPGLSSRGTMMRSPQAGANGSSLTSTPMASAVYPGSGPAPVAIAQAKRPTSPYNQVPYPLGLRSVFSPPALIGKQVPGGVMWTMAPLDSTSLPVQTSAAWQTPEPPVAPPLAPPVEPAAPSVAMLNSRRIPFRVSGGNADPNSSTTVELWYTHNGSAWMKHPETPPDEPPFTVEVKDDGLYGFCLVTQGAGNDHPPEPGETPQMLIEVDTVPPEVRLVDVQAAAQGEVNRLTIYWQARDANLAENGVALLWARRAGGPWLPIVSGLDNTGVYDWKLPAGLPPQFFVRVEAADRANNVSAAESSGPVALDGRVVPSETMRSLVETAPTRVTIAALESEEEPTLEVRPEVTLDPDEIP